MGSLRSRIAALVGRMYLARAQQKGFDLSKVSLLPDSATVPLRRDGLDPVPELARARQGGPVTRLSLFGMTVWLVTGYEQARTVLSKTGELSNDFATIVGRAGLSYEQNPGGLGFSDPPAHTRLRRVLTPEFTVRRLARLTPRIREIVDGQLEEIAGSPQPVDLMEKFALPIPSLTICELLGIRYEDRGDFQRLSTARFDLFGGASASLGAMSESMSYLRDVVKKERENPGEGMLGMLVREHGDDVGDEELVGLADGLLTGGLETTTSMLALGTILLLRDRNAAELARGDDEAVHRFVEELLRYLTVVQVAFPRFAKQAMDVGGRQVAEGDIVLVSLSGADRDPALGSARAGAADGADLEEFDPTRSPTAHLAFGHGAHRCIGAELARMELRTAYPALARRFPSMRLAVPAGELSFRKLSIVYGVDSLPVTLR